MAWFLQNNYLLFLLYHNQCLCRTSTRPLLFGLLFFLPGNSLLAQEIITSTGNYIDFSGSGFAAVPAIYPPPSTNNELTFESWVYIDNLPQDSDWDILYYLTDGWGVYLQQNGKLGFRYRVASAGNWPNLESNTALSTAEWYHIAVTYSKSGGAMKIFINGVARGFLRIFE